MPPQPTLTTTRLILRPFTLADAPDVQRLAGDRAIAEMTLLIPHPYPDGLAEKWIAPHAEKFAQRALANFAIIERASGQLIGAIGLVIEDEHARAELGYWIGQPFWCRGYCTEAARAILRFGFDELRLNRIAAHHFTRNPASGRVLQKLGMQHEGTFRQHLRKWGEFIDAELYGLLRDDSMDLV